MGISATMLLQLLQLSMQCAEVTTQLSCLSHAIECSVMIFIVLLEQLIKAPTMNMATNTQECLFSLRVEEEATIKQTHNDVITWP